MHNRRPSGRVNPWDQWKDYDVLISASDVEKGRKLASGNYGTVYEGKCRGQPVAIKVLHNQGLTKEKIEELKREVDIMRRLRHPGIMLLMGICVEQGNISIVMEYVEGRDLGDIISDSSVALSVEQRLKIAKDVAVSCNWLHCLDPPIIHRDLKPANIMLTKNFDCKVCDFGLSCLKEKFDPRAPPRTTAVGTPIWMAPEILCGYPNSEKSDVYSYSLILWELFTRGEKPFSNIESFEKFCDLLIDDGLRPPIPSDMSPGVRALIEACWAQDPKNRPSFAQILHIIDDLIIDTVIRDESGRKMWRELKNAPGVDVHYPFSVNWEVFLRGLSKTLDLPVELTDKEPLARCLQLILTDDVQNLTQSVSQFIVKCEKLGNFLDIFGPISLVDEFEALCQTGAFHGSIDAMEAEKRLKGQKAGTYLIRLSGRENCIVITHVVNSKAKPAHYRVGRSAKKGYVINVNGKPKYYKNLLILSLEAGQALDFTIPYTTGSQYFDIFRAKEKEDEGESHYNYLDSYLTKAVDRDNDKEYVLNFNKKAPTTTTPTTRGHAGTTPTKASSAPSAKTGRQQPYSSSDDDDWGSSSSGESSYDSSDESSEEEGKKNTKNSKGGKATTPSSTPTKGKQQHPQQQPNKAAHSSSSSKNGHGSGSPTDKKQTQQKPPSNTVKGRNH